MLRIFVSVLFVLPFVASGQSTEGKSESEKVINVIKNFFDGMRNSDSSMVRNTCLPAATLQTATFDSAQQPILKKGDMEKFFQAIGTPKDAIYDERIWSYDTKIDGPLASVWTEYTFFLGNQFSHCGVNNFQLLKTSDGWKIFSIVDTRRKEPCRME